MVCYIVTVLHRSVTLFFESCDSIKAEGLVSLKMKHMYSHVSLVFKMLMPEVTHNFQTAFFKYMSLNGKIDI